MHYSFELNSDVTQKEAPSFKKMRLRSPPGIAEPSRKVRLVLSLLIEVRVVFEMAEDIEPLTAEIWFDRIGMIARGELGATENALRHALHLLQLTPREFRPREYGTIDEVEYEALLETGNLETAARRLVATPTLTVSTESCAEGVEAAIKCRTLGKTVLGTGDTPAAAILQAWASCFLNLERSSCRASSVRS